MIPRTMKTKKKKKKESTLQSNLQNIILQKATEPDFFVH